MEIFTQKLSGIKMPKPPTELTPEKYEAEAKLLREVVIPQLENKS
jgi:hypothetical protein